MDSRLPLPAPLPRRAWLVFAAMLLPAFLLLFPNLGSFPGDPALPYAPVTLNLHWQLHARGLAGLVADDLHGFPLRTDRVVTDGLPLDAFTSWPFTAILGFAQGMWAWALVTLWAVGAAAAWLGMRWWGTAGAGLVAGAGYLAGGALLHELGDGRPTQVFAAIFLPLALGLAADAARRGSALAAAGAGLAMGIGTLASWGMGPILAIAAFGPFVLGKPRAALATLAAAAVVLVPALAWVVAGRGELPSLDMDPWQEAVLGLRPVRPVDLPMARLYGVHGVIAGTLARPVLVIAAVLAARAAPFRRVALPLTFACVLALLGLGSWLPGPVVGPWGWMQTVPGLSRLWWPDRAWIGVALGAAVLAAGVPRFSWIAGLAILGETWAFSGVLPFRGVTLERSPSAEVLARVPGVPLVLLPVGEGQLRPDRLDLVDQITHGRPLANGTRPPYDLTAPDAVLRGWRNNAGLRALLACETGDQGAGSAIGATDALVRAGLREVYVDTRYTTQDPSYVACVDGVLAGWSKGEEEMFLRYRAD